MNTNTNTNTQLLVAYATKHGSTHEVAEAMAEELRTRGFDVKVRSAAVVDRLDGYDGVILGSALYMGRLHAEGRAFLHRHREELATLPVAVFAMGPRTLEPSDLAGSCRQLEQALAHEPAVSPFSTAIFGGVLKPAELHFPLSRMHASDVRDWDAIRHWADEIAARFTLMYAAA